MNSESTAFDVIFCGAIEMPCADGRAAYIKKACGDDAALRERVERLVAAHFRAGNFMGSPAERSAAESSAVSQNDGSSQWSIVTGEPVHEAPGAVIGPYKLIEQIGEGGMGTVWMAQQSAPVKRLVALKLIKAGMDSRQVIARFEAERQALALMDHPNIAKVLDGGFAGDVGRPYFVMDLVKGMPITKYCDAHHLTPRQRLELFIPVCHAVQHAHQKGIIHRDLKPSNVLVALYDGKPVPKVIDFGVAKATGQSLTDKTLVTGFGNIVGTLEYMSPEQAEVNQLDIDTRSDIYSLGVLLYELLTGSPPFSRKKLEKAGMLEMLRVIREVEPSRPSTKLSTSEGLPTLAAKRGMEPRKLTKQIRGELDWIVMKALEKERSRRFESASAFAADVERYLHDDPVQACPPSVGYRLGKIMRRHKRRVMAAAAMLALLLAGTAISTWQAIRATHAEWETGEALEQVTAEQGRTQVALTKLIAEQGRTQDALTAVTAAEAQSREALDTLTDDVVAAMFFSKPELDESDMAFLRKVLGFYESFAKRAGNTPEARLTRAKGYVRVAYLRELLGKFEEAAAGYRQAERDLADLVEESKQAPRYRYLLAGAKDKLAFVFGKLGNDVEEEAARRKSLELMTDLNAQFPEDLDYLQGLAAAHINLSNLLNRKENYPDAVKLFREGLLRLERAVAKAPHLTKAHQDLAFTRMSWADLLHRQGEHAESEKIFAETVKVQEELLQKNSLPRRRMELAQCYQGWATVLSDLERPGDAEKRFHQAIERFERLTVEWPGVFKFRQSLAGGYRDLGSFYTRQREYAKAESAYGEALKVEEAAPPQDSRRADRRKSLGDTYAGLANVFVVQSKKPEAEKLLRKALLLQAGLADEFGNVAGHHNALVDTLAKLALLQEQPKDAVPFLENAREHARIALDVSSRKNATARRFYPNVLGLLAKAYMALGDHAKLAGISEEAADCGHDPPNDCYSSAALLCHCAVLADMDIQLSSGERSALAQQYTDRALVLLRKAVARDFRNADFLQKNPAFEILRGRPDFKQLLSELEAKQKDL